MADADGGHSASVTKNSVPSPRPVLLTTMVPPWLFRARLASGSSQEAALEGIGKAADKKTARVSPGRWHPTCLWGRDQMP
jgi:hypothetical protein